MSNASSPSLDTSSTNPKFPPTRVEELIQRLIDDKIEYIRFESVDINGLTLGRLVPARHFAMFCKEGLAWMIQLWFVTASGSLSPDSLPKHNFCNVYNFPIPSTYTILPHFAPKTRMARVLTYPYHANNLRFSGKFLGHIEPRCQLVRQLETLKKEFGLELFSCFEHEFQLLKRKNKSNLPAATRNSSDPSEKKSDDNEWNAWEPLWPGNNPVHFGTLLEPQDGRLDYVLECERCLHQMGVDLETLMTEHAPGQMEWCMRPMTGVKAADCSSLMRNTVKEIGRKYGYLATFATMPFPNDIDANGGCSSGAHYNFSLWIDQTGDKNESTTNVKNIDKMKNALFGLRVDKSGEVSNESKVEEKETDSLSRKNSGRADYQLSDLCLHFIGGMFDHIESLTAFCNSNVNCFRRSQKHFWSPGNSTWSLDNRTACVRVKNFNSGRGTFLEFRLPCSASCPYLVMTSVLAAGMDGIRRKLDPGPPSEGNALEQKKGNSHVPIRAIPKTLQAALDALQRDDVMKEAFSEQFIQWYVNSKKLEIKDLKEKAKQMGNQGNAETATFLKL